MKNKYFLSKTLLLFSCLTTTLQAQTTQETYLTIEAQVIKYANKDCKGSLEIFTHDGLMPFTYSIDGGKTFHEKKVFENLCEGKYFIQAKDATGKLGLTLIDLTPNPYNNNFNEAEQEAIRLNTINDLLNQRESVMDNWEKRRVIEYQLSRLGITYAPIILSQDISEKFISIKYKMLIPENVTSETVFNYYKRVKDRSEGSVIDLIIDTENWITEVRFIYNADPLLIDDLFKKVSFSGYNLNSFKSK